MSLLILNSNKDEPLDYITRKTVKGVVRNKENKILLISCDINFLGLIGGGVEDEESDEESLFRESLEEAGMRINILEHIGEVVQYRDFIKKKYIIQGYLCDYIDTISTPEMELKGESIKILWLDPIECMRLLESEISSIKESEKNKKSDLYQAKIYNREMALVFIKKIFSNFLF